MAPKRKRSSHSTVSEKSVPTRNHMQLDGFAYSELREPAAQIRLLTILPGEGDERIACRMRTFDLAIAPPYSAFSYTWGPLEPARTVTINGAEITVRYNCFYALRQAKELATRKALFGEDDDDADRIETADPAEIPAEQHVWIDSICINQSDLDEKSIQVRLMGTIYRKARRTLVSLGPHADGSEFLLERMENLVAYVSDAADVEKPVEAASSHRSTALEQPERTTAPSSAQLEDETSTIAGGLTPRSKSSFGEDWNEAQYMRWLEVQSTRDFRKLVDAWVAFVSRPYWRRLWVLQELILSSDRQWILCGDSVVAYAVLGWFENAWETFRDNNTLSARLGVDDIWEHPSPYNGLTRMLDYVTSENIREDNDSQGRILLYGISATLPHLLCHDPRDRIYGIQEVVRWPAGGAVEVSYRKSPVALMRDILAQWCAATGNTYYSIVSLYATLELGRPENNGELREYLDTLLHTAEADRSNTMVGEETEACAHAFTRPGNKSQVPKSVQMCDSYAYLHETAEGTLTVNATENESECLWTLDDRKLQHLRPVKAGALVIALVPVDTKAGDILLRPAERSLLGFVGRCGHTGTHNVVEVLGACLIRLDYTFRSEPRMSRAQTHTLETAFELCCDGDDQLRLMLALHLHAAKANYSPDFDMPGNEALSFIARGGFKGCRFSSYAVEVEKGIDADEYHALESRRLQTRVCRRCGEMRNFGP